MTYTDEQFKALAPYEKHFRSAVLSRYAQGPGPSGLKIIRQTYIDATGAQLPPNFFCNACVLEILRTAGGAWLEDQKVREAAVEAQLKKAHQVATAEINAERINATIKTETI